MKENYTHILFLLDKSGSMYSLIDSTIENFNSFIREQQKLAGKCTFTLILFSDTYSSYCSFVDIHAVEPLTRATSLAEGSTALLDAVGRGLDEEGRILSSLKEEERPSKVICGILTDGQENASKEYTKNIIEDKVKTQKEVYNWEFIFMGANIDSFATAGGLGISGANTLVLDFAPTPRGVAKTKKILCSAAAASRAGGNVRNLQEKIKGIVGEE